MALIDKELVNQLLASKWAVPAAVAAGALVVRAVAVALPLGAPARTKPFSSFAEFWPHYLKEHSKRATKRTHFVGTLFLLSLCSYKPALVAALVPAGLVGWALFPLLRPVKSGLVEMAAMMGTYLTLGAQLTGSWPITLAVPLCAYGCAWFGHFFVEKNRPATFIYPTYSLCGDLKMFFQMLFGPIGI